MRQVYGAAAARQDHRPADGGGRLDGVHPAFHAPQERRRRPSDQTLLLTAILADAINLGLTKMAESCPGTTYAKLSWLQAWHIRDETYSAALAELVNAQFRQPFAGHWGDGTDVVIGRPAVPGRRASREARRQRQRRSTAANPACRSTPTSPTSTPRSIPRSSTSAMRDATYVLDGLLYHESDLRIEEHYTDTAGFTDHVFALMHLLGFRFAPRIRDLADKRLFVTEQARPDYPALAALDRRHAQHQADPHPLGRDPSPGDLDPAGHGHGLAHAPQARQLSPPERPGRGAARAGPDRTQRCSPCDWLQDVELRRRVHAGLNKGEARNALARAVFFNRLGEMRDRSFENQRYRASGLNLVTAAIVLWNTVYLERAVQAIREHGRRSIRRPARSTCRRWAGSTST